MDRTYLYMIISVCHTTPPSRQKADQCFRAVCTKYSCLSACFLSQSINQSVSQPAQSTVQFLSVDRASLQKCILVTEEYLRVLGGLGGVGNSFFLHTKGLAQHLPFTPKKYQEFQGPQKYLKF